MSRDSIELSVPAHPEYARSVRMLASSLAVMSDMSVEDVEDIRIAAEEGFIFACATGVEECFIDFVRTADGMEIDFLLGDEQDLTLHPHVGISEDQHAMVKLLLSSICDESRIINDEDMRILHLSKKVAYDLS